MKHTLVHTLQFAEWIAERYNFIGGDVCAWCAKQSDQSNSNNYRTTGELWAYWNENINKQ